MLKFICKRTMPKADVLRFFFHANPDRLIELTTRSADASAEDIAAYRREFTAILDDIYVDGVWKRTSWGRLPGTERAIVNFFKARVPADDDAGPLRVLDVGASDGTTSVNLLSALRNAVDQPVEVTMADLNIELRRFQKGSIIEYRSARGAPVMAAFGRVGIRLPCSEHDWFVLSNWIARWYLRRNDLRAGLAEGERVPLVNPVATQDPDIKAIELNCLDFEPSLTGHFDAIRASNLISPRYGFEGARLERCLVNFHKYLKDGGCLLVSRNDRTTEVERGSIWSRTATGFALAGGFGDGSEIEEAVTAFVAQPAADAEPAGCHVQPLLKKSAGGIA